MAIKLSTADISTLALGLDPTEADHRALYVALTRARLNTLALTCVDEAGVVESEQHA